MVNKHMGRAEEKRENETKDEHVHNETKSIKIRAIRQDAPQLLIDTVNAFFRPNGCRHMLQGLVLERKESKPV